MWTRVSVDMPNSNAMGHQRCVCCTALVKQHACIITTTVDALIKLIGSENSAIISWLAL